MKRTTIHREALGGRAEVAEYLGVPVSTLAYWASYRPDDGPPFIKVGRRVRYRWADVDAWLTAQERRSA